MDKIIFKLGIGKGKKYLVERYSLEWYLALKNMSIPRNEIDEIIWKLNEKIIAIIPLPLMHFAGKSYLSSFRKKAKKHMKRQQEGKTHPYDWEIKYTDIDSNYFEIDILSCGFQKLARDFGADGLLPGICRIDYLIAHLMKNGFERTKTLGDGDECCNCKYYLESDCEWAPEKGFINRK